MDEIKRSPQNANIKLNNAQPFIREINGAPFVFDANAILRGIASGQIKSYLFNAAELEQDESNQTSYFGTPVFSNLIVEPDPTSGQTGTFTDIDGNEQSFEGIRIDTVLFNISMQKNIVKTPVQGFNGTVKEYTSDGDFEISISGSIVSPNPDQYPEREVEKLLRILSIPEPLEVTSEFLAYLGITSIVVDSYAINQRQGFRNVQPFEIRALSDRPLELI